ncbi:hypothetical protein [Microbulbifer epialgicus]|uniref:Uncharacterized protein n=1 Tax=Microbulbifer epialgicus TaxID=393907 RepID=A0ABV4P152_9GAMM
MKRKIRFRTSYGGYFRIKVDVGIAPLVYSLGIGYQFWWKLPLLKLPSIAITTKKREGKNILRSEPYETWMPITSLQGCIHCASRVQCILSF